jgi:hypothetical protein
LVHDQQAYCLGGIARAWHVDQVDTVFLIGAVARFLWPAPKSIARYVIVVAIVFVLAFVPFIALGGASWTVASLASNFVRASWSTPWALIDGNWGVGDVGDVPARTQLDLAYRVYGNPPVISSILVLVVFSLIFLWLFRRPIDPWNPQHFIWFTTLMLLLFHLWSKGWSPQWAMLIIPFILLSFPDQRGLTLVLIFTLLLFVEWPLADVMKWPPLIATVILSRTALFVALCVMLFHRLWPAPWQLKHRAPEITSVSEQPHPCPLRRKPTAALS